MKKTKKAYMIYEKQVMHYRSSRRRIEREKGAERLLKEIMDEKFPNLGRDNGHPSS